MAMNTEQLGRAVLELVTDNQLLEEGLDKAHKKADDSLKKLGDKFSSAGKKLSLAFTAPIIAGMALAVKGAAEEEKSLELLKNAIRGAGLEGELSADDIRLFSERLMKTTLYTHEQTEAAATLLTQLLRLDQDGLEALIPRIQNLSTALGTDLQQAALQVGKFVDGATNSLGRYKVPIDESATKTERLAKAIEFMDQKFSGAAETAAKTASGGFTQFMQKLGELADTFGTLLLPVLTKLIDFLNPIVDWFMKLDDGTKNVILTIMGVVAAIGPLLMIGGQLLSGVSSLINIINGLGGAMSWASAGPVGLIIAAVALLAFGVYELIKNWDTVSAFFVDMWEKVKAAFNTAIEWIKNLMRAVGQWFYDNAEWIVMGLNPIAGAALLIIKNWSTIEEFFRGLWSRIAGIFTAAKDTLANIVQGLYDNTIGKFKDLFDKLVGKSIVPEMVNGIIAEIKRMKTSISDLTGAAMNRMVDGFAQGMAAVGETIVTGGDAWMAFKDAAKSAVADVLMMIGKKLLVYALEALIPLPGLFNPVGAALAGAAAIAAFVASGVVRALEYGGRVEEPVVGQGTRTGQMYAFGERRAETMVPFGEEEQNTSVVVNLDGRAILEYLGRASRDRTLILDPGAIR